MKEKKIDKVTNTYGMIFFGIIILIPLVSMLYNMHHKNSEVEKNKVWVIAEIDGRSIMFRGSSNVRYRYQYKGKKYTGISVENNTSAREMMGKRYLIGISKMKPNISVFADTYQVPDSIKNTPYEGWEELPQWVIYKGIF